MSFVGVLALMSMLIPVGGTYAYIRDTLAGKTKPNRVSYLLWSIAPLIGAAGGLYVGADIWVSTRVFLAGFLPLLILLASFVNPKSYWRLTRFDFLCGAFSLLALIVWVLIDSPRVAILLVALGDGLAAVPTLRKAWIQPETETASTYVAFLISGILILPSIPAWNIENAAFPLFLLVQNVILVFALYRKKINLL